MLLIEDLHVYYGEIQALKGVALEVRKGEIVTLLGNNGAGKTTTLKSISGLVPARVGRITLEGEPLTGVPAHDVVRRGIAHVPEGRRIFKRLSVRENLLMGAFPRHDAAGTAVQEHEGLAARVAALLIMDGVQARDLQITGTVGSDRGEELAQALRPGLHGAHLSTRPRGAFRRRGRVRAACRQPPAFN